MVKDPEPIKTTTPTTQTQSVTKLGRALIQTPDGAVYEAILTRKVVPPRTHNPPLYTKTILLGGNTNISIAAYQDDPLTCWMHVRRGTQRVSIGLSIKKARYLARVLYDWARRADSIRKAHQVDDNNMGDGDTYQYPPSHLEHSSH